MVTKSRTRLAWSLVGLATLVAACSPDSQNPVAPDPPSFAIEPGDGIGINVCKIANDNETVGQVFNFTTSAAGGTVVSPVSLTAVLLSNVDPSACKTVWFRSDASFDDETQVTVTEEVTAGYHLDLIVFSTPPGDPEIASIENPATPSVTVVPNHGMTIFFKNSKLQTPPPPPPPPPGGQGCTPGFWRQAQHFQHWTGYATTDLYSAVFGVGPAITLLEAVNRGGGGENALLRHSVAALLNSSSAAVNYDLTTAQVIAAVQNAYATGNFSTATNQFTSFNEQSCPLGS